MDRGMRGWAGQHGTAWRDVQLMRGGVQSRVLTVPQVRIVPAIFERPRGGRRAQDVDEGVLTHRAMYKSCDQTQTNHIYQPYQQTRMLSKSPRYSSPYLFRKLNQSSPQTRDKQKYIHVPIWQPAPRIRSGLQAIIELVK